MYLSSLYTLRVGPGCCHLPPGGTESLSNSATVSLEVDGHLVPAAGHLGGDVGAARLHQLGSIRVQN